MRNTRVGSGRAKTVESKVETRLAVEDLARLGTGISGLLAGRVVIFTACRQYRLSFFDQTSCSIVVDVFLSYLVLVFVFSSSSNRGDDKKPPKIWIDHDTHYRSSKHNDCCTQVTVE